MDTIRGLERRSWNLGEAKQRLSEVVRAARAEPQTICLRGEPVAALVPFAEFEAYRAWRHAQSVPTVAAQFEELRRICEEEDWEFPRLVRSARSNAFVDLLEEVEARGERGIPD